MHETETCFALPKLLDRIPPEHYVRSTLPPDEASAVQSPKDRCHNIINGADNTLQYEVAKPWDEARPKQFLTAVAADSSPVVSVSHSSFPAFCY